MKGKTMEEELPKFVKTTHDLYNQYPKTYTTACAYGFAGAVLLIGYAARKLADHDLKTRLNR